MRPDQLAKPGSQMPSEARDHRGWYEHTGRSEPLRTVPDPTPEPSGKPGDGHLGSTRRVLRICSNNSTFDLFAMNPTVHERTDVEVDTCHPGGAKSDEHNPLKWGQNR